MNPQPCTLRGAPQAAPLLYGSVCSGIEAASLAWQPLGLEAAWFAEIDPFPSAVLAHRYPHVPNLGDMTAIARQVRAGTVPAPDILVGGTPCQSFSVAGARQGLDDPRGALTLAYVELANAIDQTRHQDRRPPATLVWENVPGVLNDRSNAFGHFLGALAGEGRALQPPGEKWAHAGCVSGPRRRIAWRVLDAQYFGVAQRRKRVFLVASGGDGLDPTEVLFERAGLLGDSSAGRAPWQEAARATEPGAAAAGGYAGFAGLTQPYGKVTTMFGFSGGTGPVDVAACLMAAGPKHEGGSVAAALRTSGGGADKPHVLAPDFEAHFRYDWNDPGPGDWSQWRVRRLMPMECERLQGMPDDYTLIPYRGKPAADAPRYKAIGNSMAVPCMAWLGNRLVQCLHKTGSTASD